jgi:hypothetical protein
MTKPNYPLFAVVHNNVVIDCGWKYEDKIISARNQNIIYEKENNYIFIEVTENNSPFYIGQEYKE